ncbi:amidohydrolase family protein [candidate division KSB1 bacterium]
MKVIKYVLILSVFLSVCAGLLSAQQDIQIIAVTNARLIDGNGAAPLNNMTIVIRNGRFSAIGRPEEVTLPVDAFSIDAQGKTVIPGLIDAHFHMNYPDSREQPFLLNEALCAFRSVPLLYRHLMGGITTILDAGAYKNVSVMAKKAFNDGLLTGSRPVVVGERINGTGGHGVSRFDMAYEADGADEFRKAVREQLKAGADLIKILPPYSREELQAAIEETHLHQKTVAVHSGIYNRQYAFVRWAVEYGADCIMHAYALPDEVITIMGEKGICSVPTMSIMMKLHLGGRFVADNKEPHAYEIIFQKMKDAGVKMAVGTDAIYEYLNENPGLYFDEVERFVKNGYTPMEAVTAATKTGAEVLNVADRLGTIERGKLADLLVLDADPLMDIRNLRKAVVIIQQGKIIKNNLKN